MPCLGYFDSNCPWNSPKCCSVWAVTTILWTQTALETTQFWAVICCHFTYTWVEMNSECFNTHELLNQKQMVETVLFKLMPHKLRNATHDKLMSHKLKDAAHNKLMSHELNDTVHNKLMPHDLKDASHKDLLPKATMTKLTFFSSPAVAPSVASTSMGAALASSTAVKQNPN